MDPAKNSDPDDYGSTTLAETFAAAVAANLCGRTLAEVSLKIAVRFNVVFSFRLRGDLGRSSLDRPLLDKHRIFKIFNS